MSLWVIVTHLCKYLKKNWFNNITTIHQYASVLLFTFIILRLNLKSRINQLHFLNTVQILHF